MDHTSREFPLDWGNSAGHPSSAQGLRYQIDYWNGTRRRGFGAQPGQLSALPLPAGRSDPFRGDTDNRLLTGVLATGLGDAGPDKLSTQVVPSVRLNHESETLLPEIPPLFSSLPHGHWQLKEENARSQNDNNPFGGLAPRRSMQVKKYQELSQATDHSGGLAGSLVLCLVLLWAVGFVLGIA
ncbi:uncharacterized protein N7482_004827 [Penicillium canariense]|uniref:Uncharacterized protein n=1 Tax=Penicillium canariense TaxID=189055 RepID=A0A9W9I9H0_9EURO|nr:uncharacterized protein N7482_004827 [Penicillium canariense]KAJ5169233.1 hypothetical protein N7482_004827 [Penicillium canariense]